MCGILGGVGAAIDGLSDASLGAALDLIGHRGPDASGLHRRPGLVLGHRRLSIIDLDPRANQPMVRDGCVVTFNGEIYNYRDLRRELEAKGHGFQTNSDTEVLLAAYREWGRACLERLEGMFAFAIWDERLRKLILARDRFGEKPLFMARRRGMFLFCSELPPLIRLAGGEALEEDRQAIGLYFLFSYIPAPFAPFGGFAQLEPGRWLEVDADTGEERQEAYFSLRQERGVEPSGFGYEQAVEELRGRLSASVRLRMEAADVPVATLLSGGVDSSVITVLADAVGGAKLTAYSLGFPEDPEFDETGYARAVAARLSRVRHRVVPATQVELLRFAERILDRMGEPHADASLIPSAFLCSHIDEKVVLGGDGADELFGGYGTYPALLLSGRLPLWLKRAASALPRVSNPHSIGRPRLRALALAHHHMRPDLVDEYLSWRHYASQEMLRGLGIDLDALPVVRRALSSVGSGELRDIQVIDFEFNLHNDMLKKVDYASMFHSLEVRLPFLDSDLVRWALGLPASYRIRGGNRKRILKDAFRRDLPPEVLSRRKMGFLLPIRRWFKGGPFRDRLEAAIGSQDVFDRARLRRVLAEHADGRVDHAPFLWALQVYLHWRSSASRWANASGTAR